MLQLYLVDSIRLDQTIPKGEHTMQRPGIPLEQYRPVFSMTTDTATPQQPIPIYFIHSLEQPYCRNRDCECHRSQREVARLLGLIADGIMTLREAADFMNGGEYE